MSHVKVQGGWTWPMGCIVLTPAVKHPADIYFHGLTFISMGWGRLVPIPFITL